MKDTRWLCCCLLYLVCGALAMRVQAETLTFKRAVELAMSRSTSVGIALADQMKAHSAYQEARRAYVPAVVAGSGLGSSWGFPLSLEGAAPSLFNVNAQSALFNPAQRQFIKAARNSWNATEASTDDQRDQVLLDTAVTFMQLNVAAAKLKTLQEQGQQSQRAAFITEERIREGVDSKVELTRANLNSARARLRISEAQATVDILKQHLAHLTGLSANGIEIDGDSLPSIPEVNQGGDSIAKALESSAAVRAADAQARSKEEQAKGEHRALYPTVDFAAQYARLARYNNYDVFYNSFQPNNATVGVSIRFPFLNQAQRAHAEAADAEVLRAKAEAQATRNLVAANTLKMQRAVEQIAAARDVAKLEWELAQSDLETVAARIHTGTATIRDQENARIAISDKYAAYLDAAFDYDKARLQLMGATGELKAWAATLQ